MEIGREGGRDDFPKQNQGFSHNSKAVRMLVRNNDIYSTPLQTQDLYKNIDIMPNLPIVHNTLKVKHKQNLVKQMQLVTFFFIRL